MVVNEYTKKRILFWYKKKESAPTISRILLEEGIVASRQGIQKFLCRYEQTETITRKPGSGFSSKIHDGVKSIIEDRMKKDDETTAMELKGELGRRGVPLSKSTILRCRRSLGWTYRGSSYCQLIRQPNKLKRLEWATQYHDEVMSDGFQDVLWTDECTVQLETHRRFCWRKNGEPPLNKPRPKHPVKVHVWAGISKQGATGVAIFEGIMDADRYIMVLQEALLPFLRDVLPHCRFMQDNAPMHTSKKVKEFFLSEGINWWKTPPESPDCNPIENLWHELKEFIRREVKPTIKQELVDGIGHFWATVTVEKCTRYISHLRRVIPKVIELQGAATGF